MVLWIKMISLGITAIGKTRMIKDHNTVLIAPWVLADI